MHDFLLALGITVAFLIILGGASGLADMNLRSSRPLIRVGPAPTMWLLDIGVVALLLGAVIAMASPTKPWIYLAVGLVAVACVVLGPVFVRDGFEGAVIARHPEGHPYRRKRRYVYKLRKERNGLYSFHYSSAVFYNTRTSDMSLKYCTDDVLDRVCHKLSKGDSLILVTPNSGLRDEVQAQVSSYFTRRGYQSIEPFSEKLPPLTGWFFNLRHRWGYPTFSRVVMTGYKITL